MFVKEFSKKNIEEEKRKSDLIRHCARFLNGHGKSDAYHTFLELAQYCESKGAEADLYGIGEFLNSFENQIAALVGKESAVFMPSGVMAQSIALRIWGDRVGVPHVGLHHTCHMEVNEHRAYWHLHQLKSALLGEKQSPFLAKDIVNCPERLAAIVLELPYRRLGGILPSWNELQEIKEACKSKGIRLHMDGARLWESQPYYQRPFHEICDGFDSVYLSFYKGIGGLSGSMLCGPRDFISEARIWLRRQGGNLYQLHPYVVSAKIGFEKRIDRFRAYYERALSLAIALKEFPEIILKPVTPQTNMIHLYLRAPVDILVEARNRIAEEDSFWLGNLFFSTEIPGFSFMEITIGDAALKLSNTEVTEVFRKFFSEILRASPSG